MNKQRTDLLNMLERWFTSQCDGDWEHSGGITIETLDNPGWAMDIELGAYPETGQIPNFAPIRQEESEHTWLHAWVEDGTFHLRCGPEQLSEGVGVFLNTFGPPGSCLPSKGVSGEQKVAGLSR